MVGIRNRVIAAILIFLFTGVAAASDGHSEAIKLRTNISAGALGPALRALAQELRFQIVYASREVASLKTLGAVGEFTPDEALQRVLAGTGLTYKYLDGRTVTIVAIAKDSSQPTPPEGNRPDAQEGGDGAEGGDGGQFRTAESAGAVDQTGTELQTIIVTAEKRRYGESLLETPVPMTVLSAQNLVDSGEESLEDYYDSVPGLNLTKGGNTGGLSLVTIRGITTNVYTNPTVIASIDDVPLGSSTLQGGGELIPDLDPSNLERVEVLRGPQGTLYGGNSMGGLIRYVTPQPSTGGFNALVQGGLTGVDNGSGVGYVDRAAANIPVSDTVALRVSAFDRHDPGYVDNVETAVDGVNSATTDGGMLSALWQPSRVFSLNLNALLQTYHQNGSPQVDPTLGDLKQSLLATSGSDRVRDQVYWLTGTLSVGRMQLKSITSYGSYDYRDRLDYGLVGLESVSQSEFGVSGALALDAVHTNRFAQELRLDVDLGKRIEWLLGGFYDHERSYNESSAYAVDPSTLAVAGYWGIVNEPELYEEYAGFTNLTYRFTDRFDIQAGARETRIRQSELTESNGLWVSLFAYAAYAPTPSQTESAFTYLLTPRFKVSSNLMAYARFASGFRPGSLNNVSPYFPEQSKPDKTQNYELGLKGDFLDGRLALEGSLYYISWQDIQIEVDSPQAYSYYATNEGAAKSEGVELSADWKPLRGLALSGWVSWDDAVLTQAFPATSAVDGAAGDRLPFSARISAHISVEQKFPISGDLTGGAGLDGSYVGDRIGDFAVTPARQVLPGYAQMNVHGAMDYRSWTGELYINNLMDKRGLLYGGIGSIYPAYFNYVTPRTVGITVGKSFQ
jgi:outer membrane receptor protein involved in Fe transport